MRLRSVRSRLTGFDLVGDESLESTWAEMRT
jgi:hypothetical protein